MKWRVLFCLFSALALGAACVTPPALPTPQWETSPPSYIEVKRQYERRILNSPKRGYDLDVQLYKGKLYTRLYSYSVPCMLACALLEEQGQGNYKVTLSAGYSASEVDTLNDGMRPVVSLTYWDSVRHSEASTADAKGVTLPLSLKEFAVNDLKAGQVAYVSADLTRPSAHNPYVALTISSLSFEPSMASLGEAWKAYGQTAQIQRTAAGFMVCYPEGYNPIPGGLSSDQAIQAQIAEHRC